MNIRIKKNGQKTTVSSVSGDPHAFYCIPYKKSVFCSQQGLPDWKDNCHGRTLCLSKKQ